MSHREQNNNSEAQKRIDQTSFDSKRLSPLHFLHQDTRRKALWYLQMRENVHPVGNNSPSSAEAHRDRTCSLSIHHEHNCNRDSGIGTPKIKALALEYKVGRNVRVATGYTNLVNTWVQEVSHYAKLIKTRKCTYSPSLVSMCIWK